MTTTVCLYARVSTEKQTTDNQIIRLREFAQSRGYNIYKEYEDTASGTLQRRPALDEMLKDAKQHKFDKILAVKIDRIGRSLTNLKNIIDDLMLWNVGLEMLDQSIDTSSASGRLMITLLGAFAEYEREIIVERTNDGIARARRQGKHLGHPYTKLSDYHINKAKRILGENPKISERKLAEQFDGIGRTKLIEELKSLGILEIGRKGGYVGVYIPDTEKTNGCKTSDCNTTKEVSE